MRTLTLCPPAIAQGSDTNLMTRLQVQRERRAWWIGVELGFNVPADFLAELEH